MSDKHIEIAEHVLPGHPDKLCDAVVDTVVDCISRKDPYAQCGLEAACVFDNLLITGRIAYRREKVKKEELDFVALARQAYTEAGYGADAAGFVWGPDPQNIQIQTILCDGYFQDQECELRHLSDDQAICVGYANALASTGHLPPAQWLARGIARELAALRKAKGAGHIGPDGKVIVRVESDGVHWTPLHVSVSLNHHEGSDWLLLREVVEEAVAIVCVGKSLPEIELNGAGMFVSGGPNGDNGLSGKKLVVDAYGTRVPIGGGAWSGKDFRKVDRIGGLLARELALLAISLGLGDEALVTLEYIPGCDAPVAVDLVLDGHSTKHDVLALLGHPVVFNQSVSTRYITALFQQNEDPQHWLVNLARWGHQQCWAPWEARIKHPTKRCGLKNLMRLGNNIVTISSN